MWNEPPSSEYALPQDSLRCYFVGLRVHTAISQCPRSTMGAAEGHRCGSKVFQNAVPWTSLMAMT